MSTQHPESEDTPLARLLADESFRHAWDMSDERKIDGAWVQGLCCECGEFVPYGDEVDHVAAAFASLIATARAEAWDEGWDERDNDCSEPYSPTRSNPYREQRTRPEEQNGANDA